MKFTEQQLEEARNKAYAKAGYNAYFGNGFNAGVAFVLDELRKNSKQ